MVRTGSRAVRPTGHLYGQHEVTGRILSGSCNEAPTNERRDDIQSVAHYVV
jgi:hypothetical protein